MAESDFISVRALRTTQKKATFVYSFFVPGNLITQIADITRVSRDEQFKLEGFQRKGIKTHVKQIAEYLNEGDVLFPNAIILAVTPDIDFKRARGKDPKGVAHVSEIGTLSIPVLEEGRRVAWIVDGQQRSLALAEAQDGSIPVPVVAFEARDLEIQREQFILVNKARPLPSRLINELLPEVDVHLPRDLAVRKIPAEVCGLLHRDPNSPFHQMIRFESERLNRKAVITDTALIESIKRSLNSPLGALAHFRSLGDEPADIDGMYETLVLYWDAVKQVFPDAWGLKSTKSRLMHGAGIRSMSMLMDHMMQRTYGRKNPRSEILRSLKRIAPHCCWVGGTWSDLGFKWNEVQNVPRHINALASQLIRLDIEASRRRRA